VPGGARRGCGGVRLASSRREGTVAFACPHSRRRGRALDPRPRAYRQLEARLAAFCRAESLLPPAARGFPACEPLEERFNELECARLAALRRLLRAPAPDLAALSLKIGLAIDDQAWELTDAEPCLSALKSDARRLAHGG
jgi:hypothetical protein